MLPTYFMVARELTKHCFHRILRCLCSFAVDAQLLNRCLASTYKYYAKGLHSAHADVAKPTYAPGSSSPIADHFISPKDTSDWSSADPYSRASTALKKLITRLRDILQGRYTTDPCHYCIVSVAAMHYC